jgi:hypothetical protein
MKSFNVVEIDVSEHWNHAPADDPKWFEDTIIPASEEKRTMVELAGGSIKMHLIVDPEDLNKDDDVEMCLHTVGHVLANPVEECAGDWGFNEGTFLGQAVHDNSCSGDGYYGFELTVGEMRKLRLVRTVTTEGEYADCEDDAAIRVRDESYDPESNPNGVCYY